MPHAVVFPPDNQNAQSTEPSAQVNVDAIGLFEQERNKVLQITNYLEALYARLLTESAGAAPLSVIVDER